MRVNNLVPENRMYVLMLCLVGVIREKEKGEKNVIFYCLVGVKKGEEREWVGWIFPPRLISFFPSKLREKELGKCC